MKKYISPDIAVVEVETSKNISVLTTSDLNIGEGESDDFNAAPRRGSSWEEYEN